MFKFNNKTYIKNESFRCNIMTVEELLESGNYVKDDKYLISTDGTFKLEINAGKYTFGNKDYWVSASTEDYFNCEGLNLRKDMIKEITGDEKTVTTLKGFDYIRDAALLKVALKNKKTLFKEGFYEKDEILYHPEADFYIASKYFDETKENIKSGQLIWHDNNRYLYVGDDELYIPLSFIVEISNVNIDEVIFHPLFDNPNNFPSFFINLYEKAEEINNIVEKEQSLIDPYSDVEISLENIKEYNNEKQYGAFKRPTLRFRRVIRTNMYTIFECESLRDRIYIPLNFVKNISFARQVAPEREKPKKRVKRGFKNASIIGCHENNFIYKNEDSIYITDRWIKKETLLNFLLD